MVNLKVPGVFAWVVFFKLLGALAVFFSAYMGSFYAGGLVELGTFTTSFAYITTISIFCVAGADQILLTLTGKDRQMKSFFCASMVLSGGLACAASLLLFYLLPHVFFDSFLFVLGAILTTLLPLISSLYRSLGRDILAVLVSFQMLYVPVVFVIIMTGAYDARLMFGTYIFSGVFLVVGLLVFYSLISKISECRNNVSANERLEFATISILGNAQASIGFVVASFFYSPQVVGETRLIVQLSAIMNFVHMAVNAYYPQRFARWFNNRSYLSISHSIRRLRVGGFFSGLVLFAVVVVILYSGLYGGLPANIRMPAILLTLVFFFTVCMGPVGSALKMTGFVRNVRSILIVSNIIFFSTLTFAGLIGFEYGYVFALGFMLVIQTIATAVVWSSKFKQLR